MTLSTYNPTTEIFNSAYIAQPGNTYRGGYQHFCCSSDAKYVYVISRQAIDLRAIIIQRSSDYGVSYTKFLLKQPTIIIIRSINTAVFGVRTTEQPYYIRTLMRLIPIDWFYIGLSKDYGVTFKTDLAVGLYGISINPTTPSFDVSPDGEIICF
jgi:hypothetical protein